MGFQMKWPSYEAFLKDLTKHRIHYHDWIAGRTRTTLDLWREVEAGESVLSLKKGIRTIRTVVLEVYCIAPDKHRYRLYEASTQYGNGRPRVRRHQTGVSEHLKQGETANEKAVLRALREELSINRFLSCTWLRKEPFSHRGVYNSGLRYKGFETRNMLHFFEVELYPEDFKPEYIEVQGDRITTFAWCREEETAVTKRPPS